MLTLKGEFVLLYYCEHRPLPKDPEVVTLAREVIKKNSPKNLARLLGRVLERDSKDVYRELFR